MQLPEVVLRTGFIYFSKMKHPRYNAIGVGKGAAVNHQGTAGYTRGEGGVLKFTKWSPYM